MKIFGLTGGIGCGKSTVSKHWAQQGLPIIDPDLLSRKAVDPSLSIGQRTLESIKKTFGSAIIFDDGTLNRKMMGSIVFGNKQLLSVLEEIIFPVISQLMAEEVAQYEAQGHKLACYDNAVLIEKSNFEKYRPIVVVHVDLDTQIQRVMGRNPHLSKDDVLRRIQSQISSEARLSYADYVIDNSGAPENTIRIANTILDKVKSVVL